MLSKLAAHRTRPSLTADCHQDLATATHTRSINLACSVWPGQLLEKASWAKQTARLHRGAMPPVCRCHCSANSTTSTYTAPAINDAAADTPDSSQNHDSTGSTASTATVSTCKQTVSLLNSTEGVSHQTSTSQSTVPAGAIQHSQASSLNTQGRHSYRVIIAYDGTNYKGWQLQNSVPTVQRAIEQALMTVFQETRTKLNVSAAGRTDAGVHAKGQVVQFYTDKEPDASRLHLRLNALLPHDVRAIGATRTAPDFHVNISAQGKTYRYLIDNQWVHDPTTYRYKTHIKHPLDVAAMQQASQEFVGKHDFTQFSNYSTDTSKRNPVKVITRFDVTQNEGGMQIEVQGEGFLYKQVRHMVGALISVGSGRLTAEEIRAALQIGSSQLPGAGGTFRGWHVAHAKGLSLHCVHYPAAVDDPDCLLYPEFPHDEFGRLLYRLPGDSDIE